MLVFSSRVTESFRDECLVECNVVEDGLTVDTALLAVFKNKESADELSAFLNGMYHDYKYMQAIARFEDKAGR